MKLRSIITLCATFGLLAQHIHALNNDELIKLNNAGLGEETILLKMDQEKAEYDLSTDGLIALKEAGISDAIVKKALMLNTNVTPSTAPAPSSYTTSRPTGEFSTMELPSIAVPKVRGEVGGKYFTRVSFFQEKNKHSATNYGRGIVVPVNTEVEVVALKKKLFTLRIIETGQEISIINIPNFTGHTTESLTENYLSSEKTPLEKLPEGLRASVLAGQLRLGMTKEIAIAARGYPPVHVTPSTDGDRWVYWSNRFAQQTVVFSDDRITEGRGIY